MHGQLKLRFLFSMKFVVRDRSLKYSCFGSNMDLGKVYFHKTANVLAFNIFSN